MATQLDIYDSIIIGYTCNKCPEFHARRLTLPAGHYILMPPGAPQKPMPIDMLECLCCVNKDGPADFRQLYASGQMEDEFVDYELGQDLQAQPIGATDEVITWMEDGTICGLFNRGKWLH